MRSTRPVRPHRFTVEPLVRPRSKPEQFLALQIAFAPPEARDEVTTLYTTIAPAATGSDNAIHNHLAMVSLATVWWGAGPDDDGRHALVVALARERVQRAELEEELRVLRGRRGGDREPTS